MDHKIKFEHLTSESLALLIVDALHSAGIINDSNFENAIRITATEIDIRKHAGDY
jgi:hypothetical protein